MNRIATAGLCAGLLLVAACGRKEADVGGVSADDAALLNNAAEMDASPDGLTAPATNDTEGEAAANAAEPPQEPNGA